ncbi:MAG: efflux RND transporter permease subunit [Clostridiales bacterium]|nr:efflux RND transporter permease subunit [Clostridiales bacterium]
MNLSSLSIKRPVATIMLTLMVVVLGIYSMISMPKDLMPEIDMPVAMVMTTYGGASPSEVESMVTEPVEQALASVEDLEQMVSYSMENMSIVALSFNIDTDMNFASLNMREAIAMVSEYLPEEASEPMVMKLDMNMLPVMQLYVSSDMELSRLTTVIENDILPYIERSSGVASVSVMGGVEEEIAIEFNQESLAGYGLNLATISQILAAENINLPSGDVQKGSTQIIVRTMGEFDSVEDIQNLPVTVADYSIVRLGDIATVTRQYQEQENLTRIDGETAIGIMISKQSDANTVDVCKDIEKVIEGLQEDYPDMSFNIGYNSADYINESISSVASSALAGALLAIIVVFLFLANIRTTLVIAVSIPTSLLAAFGMMKLQGMTLNLITLCALTLTVGMLVDNSIVVLENIFRVRQEHKDAKEAAMKGSKEVFMAVIASTITTVLVFLPIALSGGIASVMFDDFCFTIIIALLASLVVALTVVPMFSSKLMEGTIPTTYIRIGEKRYKYRFLPKFTKFIESVKDTYRIYVKKVLNIKKKFVIICTAVFVMSMSLVAIVGWELMPSMDEGSISITIGTPYGTALEDKNEIIEEVEEYILGLPEVEHVSISTGALSAMSTENGANITVLLKDMNDRKRSTEEVARDIKKATSNIAGADISVSGASSMESMFASHDISLTLMGKEGEVLEEIGNDIAAQVAELDCVETAETDVTEGNPEIKVIIDRNAAANYGITSYQLANGLSTALNGTSSTDVTINGDDISVNLSLKDSYSESVENMKQILITGSYGTAVPVSQIAQFEYDNSPTMIGHFNQSNYITINIDTLGNDLSKASAEVMKVVDAYPLPEGYYFENGGLEEEMMEMFSDLFLALIISILLVFLVLAAQFESVLMPFIVVMAIPFAMTGAFVALFITNTALSMTSFLGLIVLVGIVVNNSILLVEFINQNKLIMGRDEALVQAGVMRLRPILMSCGTTVIGMIPLSLGFGEGGELLAPMGISIIGGLIASTVVTLFLIPVLYAAIDDRKLRKEEKKRAKAAHIALLEEQWAKEDESDDL